MTFNVLGMLIEIWCANGKATRARKHKFVLASLVFLSNNSSSTLYIQTMLRFISVAFSGLVTPTCHSYIILYSHAFK